MFDYVRRHLVVLTSLVTAVIGAGTIALHAPSVVSVALVTVLTLVLGFVAMIGVVTADKLVPAGVGVVKAVFYLAVLLGAHGLFADPAFQAAVITVIELASSLLVASLVTSTVPAVNRPVVARE